MSLHHRLRTAAGSPSDPYWSNTSLLLLGNGTNGGQNHTFIDSSSNNFTITRYGNVTQGSFSPFTIATGSEYSTGVNGGSGYFDGSGDSLEVSDNAALQLGTGDFTVEAWINLSSLPTSGAYYVISSKYHSSLSESFAFIVRNTSGTITLELGGNSSSVTATYSFSSGVWYHVAAVRNGSTTTLYINGTSSASGSYTENIINSGVSYRVGVLKSTSSGNLLGYFYGYISSHRLIKGTAQYTANFTPSTTPLTAITNTSLLLNFTNASIIDSTGKNDIETVGDAQISTSVKKYGTGSLKFDGTGDYLTIPKSSLLDFGTGDFTIEAWINPTAASGTIIDTRTQDTLDAYIFNILGASGKLDFVYSSSRVTSSGAISTSVWTHVAVVRSSGTIKLYINGTEDGSASYSSAVNAQAFASIGGGRSSASTSVNGYYFNGYIDDLRISKVARYTAAFTPPSRQLPAR